LVGVAAGGDNLGTPAEVGAQLCRSGMTILLVEKALRHAAYGYLIQTGRIAAQGTVNEVQGSDALHKVYLGG
jgi:branched-chain amino acid transport system ATP-binding protein